MADRSILEVYLRHRSIKKESKDETDYIKQPTKLTKGIKEEEKDKH